MSELKDQLKRLNERVEELVNNPSELTKDALLAETRAFYDVVKGLEYETASVPEPKAKKPKVAPAPVVEPTPEPIKTPEPEIESIIATVEPPVEEPKKETPAKPVAEVKEEVEVKAEKPKAKKPMIGEDEPAAEDGDKKILAGKFNNSPLTDLRSGIPLNEKFGIIRNLFKGNASDFGDAVLKLNNAPNAKEISHYLDLLKQRFEWDERDEAYQNFVGYVERKKLTLQPSNADTD